MQLWQWQNSPDCCLQQGGRFSSSGMLSSPLIPVAKSDIFSSFRWSIKCQKYWQMPITSYKHQTHTLDTLPGINLVTLQLLDRLSLRCINTELEHRCLVYFRCAHLSPSAYSPMTYPYTVPVKVVLFYTKQPAMQYTEYHWLALPAPVCRHHSVKPLVLTNQHKTPGSPSS